MTDLHNPVRYVPAPPAPRVIGSVRVTFNVTEGMAATAIAIDARNAFTVPYDPGTEYVEHVEAMTKSDAMRAIRHGLWLYGEASWPDDYHTGAYRAAVRKVRAWWPDVR